MIQKIFTTISFGLFFATTYSQSINSSKLDSLFQVLESKNKFMGSIAISQNDKIIYFKSIGKADLETNKLATSLTKYRIGSISKMFTTVLIFNAIEEKKITLATVIDKYFPSIKNAKKITIGNLLNHRSGIHNFTNDSLYLSYNTLPKTELEMVKIIKDGKSDFEPNSKAEYSNSNFVLLSFILEKIYKKTFSQILSDRITKKIGLKNTYVGNKIDVKKNESNSYSYTGIWQKESETDMSIPRGAGAVVSTPTDLVKFIENLFAGNLVSTNSLEQMKTLKDNYGMGMFPVPFYDKKGFGHTGGIDGFSSVLWYFPSDKLSIAITSNGQNYENNNIVIAGLSSFYNKPFEIPTFTNFITKTEELDRYLGVYSSPEFPLKVTITKDNLILNAQATGQSAFPLDAITKDKFEFKAAGIKLEFLPDTKQMILKQGAGKYTLTKQ